MLIYILMATLSAEPCVSGPRVGQRPGPYSFVMSTGSERGKSQCYICETADRPMAVVFARSLSEPLAKLAAKLDKAVADYKKNELRSWLTLLAEDQSKQDEAILGWVKKHRIKAIPVGVFEDVEGPPSYRLHREADVTVLLAVKQKVVVNVAFRVGELTDAKIEEIVTGLSKILPTSK